MQSVAEEIIEFRDRQEAQALLGERDEFVRVLMENFAARFISRGDAMTISGEASEVEPAAQIMRELQYLHRQGTVITMHEVRYSVGLVKGGKGEALHGLFSDTILVTSRGRHVRPKTLGQRLYVDAIKHHFITFGVGPAGTGKTYLAVVLACAALRNREVEKVILTRPAVEAGEKLGFLPGDLQEKVDPYLRPLYDALQDILGQDIFQKFMTKGVIEVAPLAYMRGRTLENAFVILDEAQNTTSRQMKMFLTRLGFGSRMVVTGDPGQIDLPGGVTSGLVEASAILEGVKGISVVRMEPMDVIRHDVVTRIVEAYGAYEEKQQLEKEKARRRYQAGGDQSDKDNGNEKRSSVKN